MKNACKNFVETGRPRRPGTGSKPRQIPEGILRWLTGEEGLVTLRFLSMKQRCAVIWEKFSLKIGVHGLTNIYKRAGISYRFARPQARKYLSPSMLKLSPEVLEERREAADQLLDLLASKQACAFVDECTI